MLAGCALEAGRRAQGPAEIELAPHTRLKLARDLVYLPPAQALQLMERLGERPGAEVRGAVLTLDEPTPHVLLIFAKGRDIELVGWDEAPKARAFIDELLAERKQQ